MAKKIYIIDDDQDIVESTKIILEANSYQVKAAFSLEAGQKLIKQSAPDLILLDIMFPDNQNAGFDFCRELRNKKGTEAIPIIMFTAVNRKFPFHFGIDKDWCPADDFLNKPIDPKELLEKIKKLIDKKK